MARRKGSSRPARNGWSPSTLSASSQSSTMSGNSSFSQQSDVSQDYAQSFIDTLENHSQVTNYTNSSFETVSDPSMISIASSNPSIMSDESNSMISGSSFSDVGSPSSLEEVSSTQSSDSSHGTRQEKSDTQTHRKAPTSSHTSDSGSNQSPNAGSSKSSNMSSRDQNRSSDRNSLRGTNSRINNRTSLDSRKPIRPKRIPETLDLLIDASEINPVKEISSANRGSRRLDLLKGKDLPRSGSPGELHKITRERYLQKVQQKGASKHVSWGTLSNADVKESAREFHRQEEYIRKVRKSNLDLLFEDGYEVEKELQSPESANTFKNNKTPQGYFQMLLDDLYESRFLSRWKIPCAILTPIFLVLIILYPFPIWILSALLVISVAPVLFLYMLNLLHIDAFVLHHLSLYGGVLSLLGSIIMEIAFNWSIISFTKLIEWESLLDLVFENGYNRKLAEAFEGFSLFVYLTCSTLFVGFVEETLKFLVPALIFYIFIRDDHNIYNSKDKKKDLLMSLRVIVFSGVCCAIGFSVVENAKYITMSGPSLLSGKTSLVQISMNALERTLLVAPGHIIFTLISTIGLAERCVWRRVEHDFITKESQLNILYRIFRWVFVAGSFHTFFDLLRVIAIYSKSSYEGFLVLLSTAVIPLALLVFLIFYIQLSNEWSDMIRSEVIEIDGIDAERSVGLLRSDYIDSEMDDFQEVNISS